ncbi:hypothetical protein [Bosea sp. F3-2]|uniref:hypothetical protein n=1 Tax=Bosea sp. F3-2 TaxID=2599640 RepID=UPI0020BE8982|nr:hypothetical protein [Bosea sp. F3-2]
MFKMFFEMSMLAFEAQQAIWLRTIRLSKGGQAASRGAKLMVTEKVSAAQRAAGRLATGTAPHRGHSRIQDEGALECAALVQALEATKSYRRGRA